MSYVNDFQADAHTSKPRDTRLVIGFCERRRRDVLYFLFFSHPHRLRFLVVPHAYSPCRGSEPKLSMEAIVLRGEQAIRIVHSLIPAAGDPPESVNGRDVYFKI